MQPRRRRVLRQAAHVRFIDDRIFRGQMRPLAEAAAIFERDRLGRPAAGVDVAAIDRRVAGPRARICLGRCDERAARAEHGRVLAGGPQRSAVLVVRQLARVRIEEDLVWIEAIARGVDVAGEAGRRISPAPRRAVRPVWTPDADCVERLAGNLRDLCPPDRVGSLLHPVVVRGVLAGRVAVDLEQHARRVGGVDADLQRAALAGREARARSPRARRPGRRVHRREGP